MRVKECTLTQEQHHRLIAVIKTSGSQLEAAIKLGISTSQVSKIVRKGYSPSKILLEKIIREYQVSEAWLYHGRGEQYVATADELPQELIDVLTMLKNKWPILSLAKRYEYAGKIIGLFTD